MSSPHYPLTLASKDADVDSPSAIKNSAPPVPDEKPGPPSQTFALDRQASWIQVLANSRLFLFAVVLGLHLLIFSLVAGWVVFKAESVARRHHEEAKFQMVKIPLPPNQNPVATGTGLAQKTSDLIPAALAPINVPSPQIDFNLPKLLPAVADALAQVKLPDGSPIRTNVMDGLGEQMSHLLFQLPLLPDGTCALSDDSSLKLHLNDDKTHTITVLVRGVVEQATYVGGETDGYVCAGGTPQTGVCNIYELDVDDPPQTYFLNAGVNSSDTGIYKVYTMNYSFALQIKNGSRLSLRANSIDQREIANDQALVVPDTNALQPVVVHQPYNGQFIQIDAMACDERDGGNLLAAALSGNHPAHDPEGGQSSSVAPADGPPSPQTPMPSGQAAPGNQSGPPSPLAADPPSSPSAPYGKVKPFNIDMEQNGESNIWIYVGLNGGRPHRYLLDTGSWGFYALYSPKWWPGNPQSLFKTNGFDTELYGNSTYGYSFVPVFSSVSLYNYFNGVQAYQFPEKDYAIAKALTWYDDYEPQKGIAHPQDSIANAIQSANENGDDTLDNHGIFGAGTCLQFKGSDTLGYANLSNLLAQTPGDGYVITDNGPLGKATLTIGLNEAIRSQFTQHLSLRPNYQSGGFPNTHWPSYGPPDVQITLSRRGHKPIVFHGHFWIDSGNADSNVNIPDDASGKLEDYIADDNSIVPETKISVSDPTRQDGLDYTTVIPDEDQAVHRFSGHSVNRGKGEAGIWFGMDFFRRNSVLYDLKNGVMGFSPRRPELDQSVLDSP